ncbi:MAG: radical SAM protein [Oscillospiraceae bacterium]|nr:radical SAM protein [Oscillospiraceae bacterium]
MAEHREPIAARVLQRQAMAREREQLRREPQLHYLFLELTDGCDLRCRHCGSRCGPGAATCLDADRAIETIRAAVAYEPRAHIVLTGGEPLLHPGFAQIVRALGELDVFWSLVTNATLLDAPTAALLRANGIFSASVSLDGDEAEHNELRQSPWAFSAALRGIALLREARIPVQITTVVTRRTLDQLDRIETIVRAAGARSWKLVNIEPMGRALSEPELLLDREGLLRLLAAIAGKRARSQSERGGMDITYGCAHLLPLLYEGAVRTTPFLCGAGIMIASVRCNGDIVGCLDIEPRPELVQGNIYRDDLVQVWRERFAPFRRDRTADSPRCRDCRLREVCGGDSMHSWDFDRREPRMCLFAPDGAPGPEARDTGASGPEARSAETPGPEAAPDLRGAEPPPGRPEQAP